MHTPHSQSEAIVRIELWYQGNSAQSCPLDREDVGEVLPS